MTCTKEERQRQLRLLTLLAEDATLTVCEAERSLGVGDEADDLPDGQRPEGDRLPDRLMRWR